MGKPHRSPLLGYNHNFTHLGRVFHVQSEDSGPSMPRLFTHLFFEGSILASRKLEYDAGLPDDKVRAMMQGQHKTLIRDLLRARLDERIVAFFAARGEYLASVQGAVPQAPLVDTSGAAIVLSTTVEVGGAASVVVDISLLAASDADVRAGAVSEGVVLQGIVPETTDQDEAEPEATAAEAADAAAFDIPTGIPARIGPRRTLTRPIEASTRGPTPTPIVVRQDVRGSPFVRNAAPVAAKTSSTDGGVVVQRNVVVGGTSGSEFRPARIRPPVPYVVTGGGQTQRPPQPATGGKVGAVASKGAEVSKSPPAQVVAAQPVPASAPISAVEAPRTTAGFGASLADDKSLDEVILEYLAEDGDSG